MKQKRLVSMIGMLVVLFGTLFLMTGCGPNEPLEEPVYTKEDIVLTFENKSGGECYVEISGSARISDGSVNDSCWEQKFNFPTVLATKITAGSREEITVKGVVISGKSYKRSYSYDTWFSIRVTSTPDHYGYVYPETYVSQSKDQYTGGTFQIKKNGENFKITFSN